MSFLLVASYPNSIISFRGELIKAIQQTGVDVHVASPGMLSGEAVRNKLEKMNVVVHDISLQRTGLNPFSDFLTLIQLVRLMNEIKPSYILSYTIKPVIYGSIAARFTGVKNRFALITGLGYTFTGKASGLRAIIRNLMKLMYRYALMCTDTVFFQNPDDCNLFFSQNILGSSHNTVVVNGSGVDLAQFSVKPLPQQISFLLIARLLGDKGVREYVEVARRIKRQYTNVGFVLVGWLDENPDAISQIELNKWIDEEVVLFLGKLSNVQPAIANCSVYVLPSYREGTPRTVLEAMAMGRAIVTTDAPGCRETVIDGENGFLVPVKSVDALESSLCRFINNPSLCISMGKRSRKIVEKKYDVHKVNTTMLKEIGVLDS